VFGGGVEINMNGQQKRVGDFQKMLQRCGGMGGIVFFTLLSSLGMVDAQVLTDFGSHVPVSGAYDISQTGTLGNKVSPDGLNYYTDNQISHRDGEPGQTFTTGSNPTGYVLTYLYIKTGGLNSYIGISSPQPYFLHLYSVSGSVAKLLETYTSANVTFSDGDWLEWSGFSVPLTSNTVYAYSFGKASPIAGREAMAVASGTPYPGGQIGLFPTAGGTISFGSSHGYDAVFDLGIVPGGPIISQVAVSPGSNVLSGQTTTFSATLAGVQPLYVQWRFNAGSGFTNLPGATTNTLSFPATLTNSGAYELIVSNIYGAATSAPITLSVALDTNPPVVLQAFNIGATNVELDYSKTVDPATATNVSYYAFTNGLAILSASLEANGSSVLLTTGPVVDGKSYVIIVNSVLDQAIPPNTITPNTLVSFTAQPLAPEDIGSPSIASTTTQTANGVNVTTAGYDIGGTSDQLNFQYQLQSGNFDVSVCLASLGVSDFYAEAGLLARVSMDTGSPYAASLATPSMVGDFFSARVSTNGTATTSGSFPVNYPNTWLRLNRIGNVFTGFGSYDGSNWTQLGSAVIAMPSEIYLGLAVASHSTNMTTTADFVDYENTPTNALVAMQVNPHEPLGPSSRTTGIVISEIMYKQAPRTDGNNVEFLELYNTCPFFQDISSYTVTCADMTYTFPANTLIPGGTFFLLAASPSSIANVYGVTSNVFGPYQGSLKHSETVQLLDEQTNVLLTIPYTDVYPWPVAADGTGHSIVLANPTYGEGDPRAWDISDRVGGSAGQMDSFTPSPLRNVVINEILPHSENPAVPQFIELYNHSTNAVDVSGCILTDDPTLRKFVIPTGTVISPAGFVSFTQSQFGFTMNGEGETLYFIKPDGSRVLDAVQFGAQANGISYGRWPDGANDFYAFTTNTPGTNNSAILIGNIVINELMYDPISESDNDQFIELYNQGTNAVNLSGWEFTSGVTFTFPANAIIPANGYVVVGKNTANLFAHYTSLNAANTFGNFSGKLSHQGELVVLSRPETYFGTNTIFVEEDQVTYGVGGRWGEWSGGGGSSLELIDPRSNHRLAANWADSDESQKSSWTDIENTGVLDNGANYDATIDYAQIGLLDDGECLVDNIEVNFGGTNYVSNGTFEDGQGLNNWFLQGCVTDSSLENSGYESSYSLHLRCSDKIWVGDNSAEVALYPNSMVAGDTVTLRYKARWLRGWPEPLLRLNGNWLEATGTMNVPVNLGSPGAANSQAATKAGPAMYNVTHTPVLPAAGQAVVVTTQAHDVDAITNLTLYYRLDPSASYTAVPMNDGGTNGDAVPGDGIYSATIPGQAANQIVAFYIAAADGAGAATRFPSIRTDDNEPARECVVMFGDSNPAGSFGVYHLWITQSNVTRWANLGNLSRDWKNDCTFVDGNRVVYNMNGRFSGSPYHQVYDSPSGSPCSYEWQFPADDMYLGTTDFKKLHPPGAVPASDVSLQRSQLSFTFLRALGVPWLYKRYVVVYVNGNRRSILLEDTQVPDKDVLTEHFPNDDGGYLYKMQGWFEMAPTLEGYSMGYNNNAWCNLLPYTTSYDAFKVPRYRWNYEMRHTPDSYSDYTNVWSLIEAATASANPNYVANLENMANMESWMRLFAGLHAAGCWDSFGSLGGQNLYGYIGTQGTKYTLLMWELETVFGNNGSWGPGVDLLTVNSVDSSMQSIYNNPTFLRMYWRAMQELVNGPLNVASSNPLLTAKYNAFLENGLAVENPATAIEPWLSQAQTSIAQQLGQVNPANFSVSPTVTYSNNIAYVTGAAPVNVATVWINGIAYPLTWQSFSTWSIAVPLTNGVNNLNIVGVNLQGQPVTTTTNQLALNYSGTALSPVGQVAINEIMFNPAAGNAQYVELYNNATNTAFDLSGWEMSGLGYTFPAGSLLAPQGYLVLAANVPAFAAAYGATIPVFDAFGEGVLATNGPTLLSLEQPAGSTNTVIAAVQFDDVLPWPTNAAVPGFSLQLIDPLLDNWRVGNWATGPANMPYFDATPEGANSVAASLPPFAPLWINEVEPANLTGITNSAGEHAPWIEIYNPSTNAVALTNLYLTGDYTDLTNWAFPVGASINPGQFLVVFADGQSNLSTLSELHTSFALNPSSGGVALSSLYNGQPLVLDYVNYTNLPANWSYGSLPDGQSFVRAQFFNPTPGAANDSAATPISSFILYSAEGSNYTQNFDSLPDPGATSVNSDNPVTINGVTYSLGNPFDFAGSVSATGSGGLGLTDMAGWYGLSDPTASVGTRFGATDGDQTTGGQNSFGLPDSSNRALGLLATSTTGYTAYGVKFINDTGTTLNYINLQVTGEVWRQSSKAKTLECYYYIDPTATAPFSTAVTGYLPEFYISFPTVAADVGGVAVDGAAPGNQTALSVTNQPISSWPAGTAFWLVWEMASSSGTSQGLAIDNFSFAATSLGTPTNTPSINIQPPTSAESQFMLSWPVSAGYQLYTTASLTPPVNWTLVTNTTTGIGESLMLSLPATNTTQFFRLIAK
jgi:Lamin Tail Domain/CotH kinase protein